VQLLPRQCRVNSRSECDPSIQFGPHRFKLPAVPANMKTVIDEPIAEMLAREGRTELARQCFDFLPTRAALDLAGWDEMDVFAHS
jgi:hypothetical protein